MLSMRRTPSPAPRCRHSREANWDIPKTPSRTLPFAILSKLAIFIRLPAAGVMIVRKGRKDGGSSGEIFFGGADKGRQVPTVGWCWCQLVSEWVCLVCRSVAQSLGLLEGAFTVSDFSWASLGAA